MIRVALADDHAVVRAGIARMLAEAAEVQVVAEFADGAALLQCLEQGRADVAVIDISMPGPPFIDLLATIRAQARRVGIVVLSMHPEEQFAARALKAGADGYVAKHRSPEELVAAIRQVAQGKKYVTPELAQRLALGVTGVSAGADALSDREFQVLRLLGAGKTVGDVARALDLSPKTVSTYRTRILEKLELTTTAELVRFAVEHNLVDR